MHSGRHRRTPRHGASIEVGEAILRDATGRGVYVISAQDNGVLIVSANALYMIRGASLTVCSSWNRLRPTPHHEVYAYTSPPGVCILPATRRRCYREEAILAVILERSKPAMVPDRCGRRASRVWTVLIACIFVLVGGSVPGQARTPSRTCRRSQYAYHRVAAKLSRLARSPPPKTTIRAYGSPREHLRSVAATRERWGKPPP